MKLTLLITAVFSVAITAAGAEHPILPADTENVDCYYSPCSIRPVCQLGFIAKELFFCNRQLQTKQKKCCEQVPPRKPKISMS
ncbi:hypothetical protein FPQ18DRAFT_67318 [Pyronema domesticum]|nr:hypothetical protein FPQ18DRAFT_67318 [Pyronema domesticum]